jgi:hypothetical protein
MKSNNILSKAAILFYLTFSLLIISCEKPIEYDVADIPNDFAPLPKPTQGLQIHVPPFPVPANFEREWYMRMKLGNKEKIYVTAFEAKMRPGTHHFIAYPFENENDPNNPPIGIMRDQNLKNGKLNLNSNNNMLGFVLETTAPEYRIDIPAGYAIPFESGATLDFNSHYFNKRKTTIFGEVYMNLETKTKDQIKGELEFFTTDNADILEIPANTTKVIEHTEIMDKKREIVVLTSHCHKRGKKFDIYLVGGPNDGKLLYSTNDYQHPEIKYYDKPLVIEKGQGLKSVITYVNETNRDISFGVTSEDEMGIVFAYSIKN